MLAQNQIVVLFLLYATLALHPLHITVTNIDYKKNEGQIDISIKLFKDDFGLVLYQKYKQQIDLENEQKPGESDSVITRYVEENFKLEIDQQKVKLKLKDKKIDPEAVWLSYIIDIKHTVGELKLENSLLTDLYNDQKNLVIVNFDSRQKGFTLSKEESVFSINLN
ncbi:MAG: hypothetical protein K9H64_21485 [Bacteroidales bacterium]|nr:hypothetical protein [Bacteroidales bacterium]MCF8458614.1 hypothetical protein [Bacteroidales bacterium]